MDYMKFVDYHRATGADISIGCLPVDEKRASDFGLMKIDEQGRIVEFAEKPKGAALQAMKVDTTVLGECGPGGGGMRGISLCVVCLLRIWEGIICLGHNMC
jgi:hypothetical protein